jgi:hypothetical protein
MLECRCEDAAADRSTETCQDLSDEVRLVDGATSLRGVRSGTQVVGDSGGIQV